MKAKWQWLCECLFLLLHGWWPVYVDDIGDCKLEKKRWLWKLHAGCVEYHYLRRNAYSKAKDKDRQVMELHDALEKSQDATDRCRLLLATTLEVLDTRDPDVESTLIEQIRAELAPKKKAAK